MEGISEKKQELKDIKVEIDRLVLKYVDITEKKSIESDINTGFNQHLKAARSKFNVYQKNVLELVQRPLQVTFIDQEIANDLIYNLQRVHNIDNKLCNSSVIGGNPGLPRLENDRNGPADHVSADGLLDPRGERIKCCLTVKFQPHYKTFFRKSSLLLV